MSQLKPMLFCAACQWLLSIACTVADFASCTEGSMVGAPMQV